MVIVQSVLLFIGSLGFLLYGMRLMSDGVQKSTGEKLQYALGRMTDSRFMGLLTGLVVTMLIQSSSATTVMVVSFVNAGLLSLAQSVGVIFGANIGTTITAWIVSLFGFKFSISDFAVPVVGIGFFLTLMKSSQCKNIGEAVMGFGLLFFGLGGLKDTFSFDPSGLEFFQTIQNLGAVSILIGFFLGIFITMLMHSSSAFTTIVIAMAFNNILTWEVSAAMALGSNIGTTIDAVLASICSSANARRAAVIHVAFNVFGTMLALIFFRPLLAFVSWITPGSNIAIRISMLHTVFNTLTMIVLMPFVDQIVRLSKIVIKDDKDTELKFYHLDFQESTIGKDSAAMHIVRVEKEIADMSDVATAMFDRLQAGFMGRSQEFIDDHISRLELMEDYCDQMHEQLVRYIINCGHLPVTEHQRANLSAMVQVTDYLEAMTDECYAAAILLQRSIEKKMKFPQEDLEQFIPYMELVRQFLQFIRININKHLDSVKLEFATELEDQIDLYRKNLKKVARKRLEGGANVKAELLYLDLVGRIEKIGDHAFSISGLLAQIV